MIRAKICLLGLVCFLSSPVALPDDSLGADTFSPSAVLSGSRFSERLCDIVGFGTWVVVDGQGDCMRYFAAGFTDTDPKYAVVFIHGDQVAHYGPGRSGAFVLRSYSGTSAQGLSAYAHRTSRAIKHPFIWLSRPGVYGSSGDHHNRRKRRESRLIDAALSEIKRKFGIEHFVLAGFSGGGHSVAALLTQRTDINCAVIASGVVDVAGRIAALDWPTDITGHDDYYDPSARISEVLPSRDRRVFILASVKDQRVPYSTQLNYYHALRSQGHHGVLINFAGHGEEHHLVDDELLNTAALCADGASDALIRKNIGLY